MPAAFEPPPPAPFEGARSGAAGAPTDGDEGRRLLQDRLARFGLAWMVGAAALLVALAWAEASTGPWLGRHLSGRLALGTGAVAFTLWWLCQLGGRPERVLLALDLGATLLFALLHSAFSLAPIAGEGPGAAGLRAAALVAFGLVLRAVVVPSPPRRTLRLGLAATVFPTGAHLFAASAASGVDGPSAVWAALFGLGATAVSTLASRSTVGLRQEVREAWQLGQYTLLEKIGEGGMGAVYRASHAMLRRPTAVKLLPPGPGGADRLERFEREVQMTSRLTHPNTVAVFDYGRTPDGVFYYAMEYLEGLNLEDLTRYDGPQPEERVVHVLRQIAGSLAEAHDVGLIHRDVKPANVILVARRGGAADVAKVVDFGLVRELLPSRDPSSDDLIAGTPLYLAPEAIRTPSRVGARSDLYSLGCVGYYLLTGRPVFEGRTALEVCTHHLHTAPTPPAEKLGRPVAAGLSALLLGCLEKEPSRRPAYAGELLQALDALALPPWTAEDASSWWSERGAGIVARVRAEAKGARAPARRADLTGLDTRSFIRRAGG